MWCVDLACTAKSTDTPSASCVGLLRHSQFNRYTFHFMCGIVEAQPSQQTHIPSDVLVWHAQQSQQTHLPLHVWDCWGTANSTDIHSIPCMGLLKHSKVNRRTFHLMCWFGMQRATAPCSWLYTTCCHEVSTTLVMSLCASPSVWLFQDDLGIDLEQPKVLRTGLVLDKFMVSATLCQGLGFHSLRCTEIMKTQHQIAPSLNLHFEKIVFLEIILWINSWWVQHCVRAWGPWFNMYRNNEDPASDSTKLEFTLWKDYTHSPLTVVSWKNYFQEDNLFELHTHTTDWATDDSEDGDFPLCVFVQSVNGVGLSFSVRSNDYHCDYQPAHAEANLGQNLWFIWGPFAFAKFAFKPFLPVWLCLLGLTI